MKLFCHFRKSLPSNRCFWYSYTFTFMAFDAFVQSHLWWIRLGDTTIYRWRYGTIWTRRKSFKRSWLAGYISAYFCEVWLWTFLLLTAIYLNDCDWLTVSVRRCCRRLPSGARDWPRPTARRVLSAWASHSSKECSAPWNSWRGGGQRSPSSKASLVSRTDIWYHWNHFYYHLKPLLLQTQT